MTSNFVRWLSNLKSSIEMRDYNKLLENMFYAYAGIYLTVSSRCEFGTNVFDEEWDALIVLDACRIDAVRELSSEYDFINSIDSIWSVGSNSQEWYIKTFTKEYKNILSNTALISSNPNAEAVLFNNDLSPRHPTPFLHTNWKTVTNNDMGYIELTRNHERPLSNISGLAPSSSGAQHPSYVTDRTIIAGRKGFDRIVAHYFQPHRPFIHDMVRKNRPMEYIEDRPFEAIKEGKATKEDIWPLYLDNLRLVLDSVERLLNNLDAEKVVITSDHAELFGEMGQFGHFLGVPHPNLKKVPWIKTSAKDLETSKPEKSFTVSEDINVSEQLRELGYL